MKSLKTLTAVLSFMLLLLLVPTEVFANTSEEHVRIPITLVPTEGEDSTQPTAKAIEGYVDFWTTTSGIDVTAHWKVVITSPKTYITRVNLSVGWSPGGYKSIHNFNYATFGTPTSVTNIAENFYSTTGTHSATIMGSVSTTKGVAYTVKTGTIKFKL